MVRMVIPTSPPLVEFSPKLAPVAPEALEVGSKYALSWLTVSRIFCLERTGVRGRAGKSISLQIYHPPELN